MTNEQYLIASYFAVAGVTVPAAVVTGLVLRGPLRSATARLTRPVQSFMRRGLFSWLILAALLGFLSVGYFGSCHHETYESVVADMPWMVERTRIQLERISLYLLIGVFTYTVTLAVVLGLRRDAAQK